MHRRKNFCENNTKKVPDINSLPVRYCGFLQRQKTKRAQAGIAFAVYEPNVKVHTALEAGNKLRLPSGFAPS